MVRVGDPPDLPLGSDDVSLLLWAEREGRILVTEDKHTLPAFLAQHLQAGRHSPGVFIISSGYSLSQIVAQLELVAYAGDPRVYQDAVTYIP